MPHLFAWLQPERLQRRLPFFLLMFCEFVPQSCYCFEFLYLQGSYRVLNSWKSQELCPAIFQTRKKSGKNRKKSWAFWQLQQLRYKWIFFRVSQIVFNLACTFAAHRGESFVPAFFFFLFTCLITLSFEKEIIVWEKVWKKVVNFGSKNLYDPRTWYTALILSLQTRKEGCAVIIYDLRYDFCISFANEAVHILITESKL